jgi:LacI family transcriptional regulator
MKPGLRPPTTADLAQRLGLAATTVAAALRGETRIAAATRERVRRAAEEAGYRRNVAAAVLGGRRRADRSPTLSAALLTRLVGEGGTPYPEILRESFATGGWSFKSVNLMAVRDPLTVARRLEAQGVDALVLGPTTPTDLPLPELPWERFALVSVIRQRVADGVDVVRVNHFSSVLGLVHEVAKLGYRRIGVLHRPHRPVLQDDDARLAAFLLLQQRRTPANAELFLHELPFVAEDGGAGRRLARLRDWLGRHRPEVVIGFNASDRQLLAQAGRRVPEDLAFAALHVYRRQRGEVAGLAAPAETIADLVRIRLEQKLRLGELGLSARPQETVVAPEFIPGASLPARAR